MKLFVIYIYIISPNTVTLIHIYVYANVFLLYKSNSPGVGMFEKFSDIPI